MREKISYSETYLFQLKNIYQIEGRYIFECIFTVQPKNAMAAGYASGWMEGLIGELSP